VYRISIIKNVSRRGVGLTLNPHLVPKVIEKGRSIPLLTLRACLAYKKMEKKLATLFPEILF
jgi:hypothetical protein